MTVTSLEMAKAAILARTSVITTDEIETTRLLRVGVRIAPVSKSRLKFEKFHLSGRAKGSEMIFRSLLKAPMITIEQGTITRIENAVSKSHLKAL